jgi:hypothetical protein
MKYIGYSTRSLEKSKNKRDKVYKLQIVEIGAIKKSKPGAPNWTAEAAKKPLLPARLHHGVPKHFSVKVSKDTDLLHLKVGQFKTFMDQIGHRFGRVDVL